jgi:hypothetical protein
VVSGFNYSREWWCDLRSDLDRRYVESKDSQGAVLALAETYGRIPPDQRSEVDTVLLEWVLSDEEGLRFDALAIVDEYRITDAIPVLRALQDRLETESGPGAPYEWAKVNRILGRLTSADS